MTSRNQGLFVQSTSCDWGIGKVLEQSPGSVTIEYFDSPVSDQRPTREVPLSSVSLARLGRQTRVYAYDAARRTWLAGRVLERIDSGYLVQFPQRERLEIDDRNLYVRWNRPIQDPTPHLACRITETPFFHDGRARFVASLIRQRAACAGMPGLFSAVVDLESHQVEVIRRVLQDPVQRYLLADEVGLGKTIEAGAILRQYVLDEQERARALVVVPAHLVDQWSEELRVRFLLEDQLDDTIRVVPSTDLEAIHEHRHDLGMLIVDEAHHVAGCAASPLEDEREIFEEIRTIAHQVPRLLLLSATPVLHNEAGFLAMLHLLDPAIYRLYDVAAFRERIEHRQQIAELFHSLVPEAHAFQIEQVADELRESFPADARLKVLLDQLAPFLDFDVPEDDPGRIQAVQSIRIHISETYRLHRRLLRNRRTDAMTDILPGRDGLTTTTFSNPIGQRLEGLIEDWRTEALQEAHGQADPGVSDRFGGNLRLLVEAALSDRATLCTLVQERLDPGSSDLDGTGLTASELESLRARPCFDVERPILAEIARTARSASGPEPRQQALMEVVDSRLENSEKVVVFASSPRTADRLFSALQERYRKAVARHAVGGGPTSGADWSRFRTDEACRILVCDRRAEEGLNLQGGLASLVHYDLPLYPNRIEQRLGRLDRYGTGGIVRSFALLDRDSLYAGAWYEFLQETLGVFDRSIATLQYVVDEQLRDLWPRMLLEGPACMHELIEKLEGPDGVIERELHRIRVQDELDAIEAANLTNQSFFDTMCEVDANWRDLQEDTESWIVSRLLFERAGSDGASGKVVRYHYDGRTTLLPQTDLWRRFSTSLDTDQRRTRATSFKTLPLTYSRVAAQQRGVRLARLGEPFIDAMMDYIRWDDRGTAFALWRYRPNTGLPGRTFLAFRLDFVVEADLGPARRILESDTQLRIEALQRRADQAFPPIVTSLWLDEDLRPVADPALQRLLEAPYRQAVVLGQGRDYNLDAERWEVLRRDWDPTSWSAACQALPGAALSVLRERVDLETLTRQRAGDATRQVEVQLEQLRSRLAFLEGRAKNVELGRLELEESLGKALVEGIEAPLIRIDALGAVFLSNDDPFRDGGA